jgi:hypothetical protein
MLGIHGASWKQERLAGVAFTLQISKHAVECQADDSRHILANDPSGPCLSYDSEHLRPERTVIIVASAFPGEAVRLARESSGNKVNWSIVVSSEFVDVVADWHVRPVFLEHPLCVVFTLAEGHCLDAASHACSKSESTDAREQIQVSQGRQGTTRRCMECRRGILREVESWRCGIHELCVRRRYHSDAIDFDCCVSRMLSLSYDLRGENRFCVDQH